MAFLATSGLSKSIFVFDIEANEEWQLTGDTKISVGLEYGGAEFGWDSDSSGIILSSEGKLYYISVLGGELTPIETIGMAVRPSMAGERLIYSVQHNNSMFLVLHERSEANFGWPKQLLQKDFIYDPILHHSGSFAVFHGWDNPNMNWNSSTLELIDIETGQSKVIAGGDDVCVCQPQFSPDGKYLTYLSDATGWLNLYLSDADGSNASPLLPQDIDQGSIVWTSGERNYVWADSVRIVFYQNNKGISSLHVVNIQTKEVSPLLVPNGIFANLTSDGKGVVFLEISNYSTRGKIIKFDLDSLLNTSSYETFKQNGVALGNFSSKLIAPRIVEWSDEHGSRLSGLYYEPEVGTSPPPLLMLIHGGPTGQFSDKFHTHVPFFVNKGWAVFGLNYRGSTGNGRQYREQLNGNWGIYDVEDVKSAVDHLSEQGLADKDRCAIMGGSAGGFTVLMALAKFPGVFRAGVNLFGVSDLYELAQVTHYLEAHYIDIMVGPYPEAKQKYIDQSPITYADKITDPLLILQGENDTAVPPSQSEAIAKAVKGVVEFKLYEGEGHGFRKLETLIDMYPRIEKFLQTHVLM